MNALLKGGLGRGLREDLRLVADGWRWTRRPLLPESARPYAAPPQAREFPTEWARRRLAVEARSAIQRFGLAPLLRAETQPVVSGLDVLESLRPPVIFVANHASHLDTALLLCSLPEAWRRRTTVAAAADYFFDVWWRAVGSTLAFNTFPIDRRAGSLTATPAGLLDAGWNMVVFPEGSRTPDGWMQRFRPGAAYLSVEHDVPVVPIGLRGSFAAMPRGRGWPVPGRPPVHIRYGPPMRAVEGEDLRDYARRMQRAVCTLIDEDETTWWESLRRREDEVPRRERPRAEWRRIWEASQPPPPPAGSGPSGPSGTAWRTRRR